MCFAVKNYLHRALKMAAKFGHTEIDIEPNNNYEAGRWEIVHNANGRVETGKEGSLFDTRPKDTKVV